MVPVRSWIVLRRRRQSAVRCTFHKNCLKSCCSSSNLSVTHTELIAMQDQSGSWKNPGIVAGRPQKFDVAGVLGLVLVLFWCHTSCGTAARAVSLAFCLIAGDLCDWLCFGQWILLHTTRHHPDAKVCPPTGEDINSRIKAIVELCPLFGEH